MNIFISFSGSDSKAVGEQVHEWLLNVFQNVNVWMSAHDLGAGTLWSGELHRNLKASDFGILCLTAENQTAPWILYEAGCLVMSVEAGRVVPLLIDLQIEQLKYPLCQLQSVSTNEDGFRRLVESINQANPNPLNPDRLARAFDKWWPDLREKLTPKIEIQSVGDVTIVTPLERKMLDEVRIQDFRAKLKSTIEGGAAAVVLNCQNIEYASSSWIGAIIANSRTAQRVGCGFFLANVQADIREPFEITRLNKVIPVSYSLDEAKTLARKKIDAGEKHDN